MTFSKFIGPNCKCETNNWSGVQSRNRKNLRDKSRDKSRDRTRDRGTSDQGRDRNNTRKRQTGWPDGDKQHFDYTDTRFNTKVCRHWANRQTCPYGDACKFGHGFVVRRLFDSEQCARRRISDSKHYAGRHVFDSEYYGKWTDTVVTVGPWSPKGHFGNLGDRPQCPPVADVDLKRTLD
jgi:hypothetical protein